MAESSVLATLSPTASSQAVLFTLIATILLLALRAWSRSSRALLTRMIVGLLDGAIVLFIVLFLGLVILRFKSLA